MKFRKPLAGLLLSLAVGASIATSKAYPEWSAESESESMDLVDFVQPQIVHLELDGLLGADDGYFGTELSFDVRARVLHQVDEQDEDDTGDTGGDEEPDTGADTGEDEDPGEELEPLSLQLELSSASLEEALLLDVPLTEDLEGAPSTLPWALVLPCAEDDLSLCSDDVRVLLVLSRPLEDGESIEGDLVARGRASGPSYGEEVVLPEVTLSLTVEPAEE